MDRITNQRLANALAHYKRACDGAGINTEGLCIAAPYGQVTYVLRYVEHMPTHDMPGFTGSGGSGFTTKRDLYNALQTAARTLFDLADWRDRSVTT